MNFSHRNAMKQERLSRCQLGLFSRKLELAICMCEESPGDKPDSRELRPNLSGRRVQTADVDKFALVSFESSRFQPLGTGTLGSIRSASGSRRPEPILARQSSAVPTLDPLARAKPRRK